MTPPLCTGCEVAPATMLIRIRGCEYARCEPCGNALLVRLPKLEPNYDAEVVRLRAERAA